MFPVSVFAQFPMSKQQETKVYTQAITEYLKAVKTTHQVELDTLFVGPNDPDFDENICDVILPKEILKTKLMKLNQKEGERKANYNKSIVFANVIGALGTKSADFIFVTFNVEKGKEKTLWTPQHNFYVYFKYDPKTKGYIYDRQRFEYNYPKKN